MLLTVCNNKVQETTEVVQAEKVPVTTPTNPAADSHTVTVKGIDQYSYSFIKGGYNYTGIDSFMAVNDHWQASGTTAYLNIPGLGYLTYFDMNNKGAGLL
jgi:hypothetical protein